MIPNDAVQAISPCTARCLLNAATGLCEGCWRTMDEIAGWTEMDQPARLDVLLRVTRRRANADRTKVAASSPSPKPDHFGRRRP